MNRKFKESINRNITVQNRIEHFIIMDHWVQGTILPYYPLSLHHKLLIIQT